jgi:hypothetical protein
MVKLLPPTVAVTMPLGLKLMVVSALTVMGQAAKGIAVPTF